MATYISENEFRNCGFNFLSTPSPFVFDGSTVTLNEHYNIEQSILKRLAIDDTFHDLSQDRDGYNNKVFNKEGPLNYLLTGEFGESDFLEIYKSEINYPEFSSFDAGKRFESKVTKSIEINKGLQSADTIITYDRIISEFNFDINTNSITISEELRQTVLGSNGSLKLIINTENPNIKEMEKKKMSFSKYIVAIANGDEKLIEDWSYRIGHFIRWFLHSPNLDNDMPNEPMKILSDAGIGFLGDVFSVPNSKVTPFIAIPCFLDSASTSTEPLDQTVPIVFEEVIQGYVVPIVSNYFSCNEYFICYLPNDNSTFDINNLYSFSLAIFNIQQVKEVENVPGFEQITNAINYVKGSDSMDTNYYTACSIIKNYIDSYPQLVARYYFGEVKKQQTPNASDANDFLTCGTCGAGVPYIGKIINLLMDLIKGNTTNISGEWLSPNITAFKNFFNTLKTSGPLNSRIPISDSRILKLFCYLNNNNGSTFLNMTDENLKSLFKLLADYKRTGDYQQSYTVLKQILKEGNNVNCYTFCSGDELSTLVGRLLGVPSIYQIGATATCSLFRCDLLNASPVDRLKLKIRNDATIFNKYTGQIISKFNTSLYFVNSYYVNICNLRKNIYDILNMTVGKLQSNGIELFLTLRLWNAYYILNNILKNCELLQLTDQAEFQKFHEDLTTISQLNVTINSNIAGLDQLNESQLTEFQNYLSKSLKEIADFENRSMFDLYNILDQDYPLLQGQPMNYFNPLTQQELVTGTFTREEIGLNLKNYTDSEKSTKPLVKYILSQKSQPEPTRKSTRTNNDVIDKKEIENNAFVNNYNNFLSSMEINNMYDTSFEISNVTEFNVDYIQAFILYINDDVNAGQQCSQEQLILIQQSLTQILSVLLSPQQGGKYFSGNNFNVKYSLGYSYYNQKGGTKQQSNQVYIYNEINRLLLNLMNKCSVYVSNVVKDESINFETMNMPQILITISRLYETDNFCQQILVQQDDNYTLENEQNGFVVALKILAEQFSYSDLVESTNDDLLTVNHMLDFLELPYIKLVIYLLSWRNPSALYLSSDLMNYDLESYVNDAQTGQPVCNTQILDDDQKILCCVSHYLNENFKNYFYIFEHLRNPVLFQGSNETFSIFGIMTLACTYFTYYGYNSSIPDFYDRLFSGSSNGLESTFSYPKRYGLKHLNYSPIFFLQNIFPTLLNVFSSDLLTKLGAPAQATSVASGIRPHHGGMTRKNGKSTKIKTIKHRKNKKIGKSKNKSRRRFDKKKNKKTRK
jgi:hypothetical protein